MARSKWEPQPDDKELLAELDDAKNEVARMFDALRAGAISEMSSSSGGKPVSLSKVKASCRAC
jgi:hypothetical protein